MHPSVLDCVVSQQRYCQDHDVPLFMPAHGYCTRCGTNIFYGTCGYTLEYATTKHITSCPYCNHSFDD